MKYQKRKKWWRRKKRRLHKKMYVSAKNQSVCVYIAIVFKMERFVALNVTVRIVLTKQNFRMFETLSLKKQKKSILWLLPKNIQRWMVKLIKSSYFTQEVVDVKKLDAIEITVNVSKLVLNVVICVSVEIATIVSWIWKKT